MKRRWEQLEGAGEKIMSQIKARAKVIWRRVPDISWEQEKGHRWEEALSSIDELTVDRVSFETALKPQPADSLSRAQGLRNRMFMVPTC